jgi:hypothetical protein
MAAETDPFIIATYALWAGDFDYAEGLLREFSPPHRTSALTSDGVESPEAVIKAIGALRVRQLRQKRAEFNKLAAEQRRDGIELTDTPIILETKHLRACLWRRDEREFVMRGYLTDLSWEKRFLELAREASLHERRSRQISPNPEDLFRSSGERYESRGGAWTVEENIFIRVDVNDLGQLQANGLWPRVILPLQASEITVPFLNVLKSLDRYVGPEDLHHEITE